jgi:uncharacterized delta-60 repeat protein
MKNRKFQQMISVLALLAIFFASSVSIKAIPGFPDESYGITGFYIDTVPLPGNQEGTAFFDGEVTADGKLTAVGAFSYPFANSFYPHDFYVQRILPNGVRDTSFGNGTGSVRFANVFPPGSSSTARAVRIQQDNKIVIAGICNIITNYGVPNQQNHSGYGMCAARLNPSGSLDTSFGGNNFVVRHEADPNTWFGYTMPAGTTFVHYPGQVETGYGGVFQVMRAGAFDVAIHSDGRIVLAGMSASKTYNAQGGFVRFNHFATLATLTPSGALSSRELIGGEHDAAQGFARTFNGVETQSDGSVIAVGENPVVSLDGFVTASRWLVYNGNINGAVTWHSENLPPGARATAVKFTRGNKTLVSGTDAAYPQAAGSIRRFHSNNLVLDNSFGDNGKIVYCRETGAPCASSRYFLLNAGTFKIDSIQNDGKILAVLGGEMNGLRFPFEPLDGFAVARFNPDGSVDRSFGDAYGTLWNDLVLFGTARLHRDTPQGIVQTIRNAGFAKLQPDGKILSGGVYFPQGGGPGYQAGVARRLNTFRNGIYSDFNNDGRGEVSVYRDGTWYWLDSFSNQFKGIAFGASGDRPVPADYDGDGRTDVAVYRPSSGTWYIYQSATATLRGAAFGAAGDVPRPGDFNGDGYADLAVFRPSNGYWYILYSNPIQPGNTSFAAAQFGQSGDIPLLADFDGDGKTDVSVFRNGVWHWLQSTNGQYRFHQFGQTGDVPVVGDYDADGKSDIAVFRNGAWYVLRSLDGTVQSAQFGAAGDRAVTADYDNDGRNDYAVFRAGNWYVLRSSDNTVFGIAFGAATDTPVPAAYQNSN